MPNGDGATVSREREGESRVSDQEALFPHREVTLLNGRRIRVEPWGLNDAVLVLDRLRRITPKLERGDTGAQDLLAKAYDETVDLVCLTVGVEREEMGRRIRDGGWAFEDLLSVTDAVLEVCVIRSDGGGVLPFLVSLMGRLDEMWVRTLGPALAQRRLRDLRAAGTSDPKSPGDSASGPTPASQG